jgi:hypothetical protein
MIVSPQTSADKQGNSTKARNQLGYGFTLFICVLGNWCMIAQKALNRVM